MFMDGHGAEGKGDGGDLILRAGGSRVGFVEAMESYGKFVPRGQ